MKMKLLLSVLGISLASASVCQAGYTGFGKISNIMFMGNGTVIFTLSSPFMGTKPACANSYPDNWSFETSTPAGKSKLAGLLTAYSNGAKIKISGTGGCDYWGDREGVDYFQTE